VKIRELSLSDIGSLVTLKGAFPETEDEWQVTGYLVAVEHSGPPRPRFPGGSEPFVNPDDYETEVTITVGPDQTRVRLTVTDWQADVSGTREAPPTD
jgi:hypothetical protein